MEETPVLSDDVDIIVIDKVNTSHADPNDLIYLNEGDDDEPTMHDFGGNLRGDPISEDLTIEPIQMVTGKTHLQVTQWVSNIVKRNPLYTLSIQAFTIVPPKSIRQSLVDPLWRNNSTP